MDPVESVQSAPFPARWSGSALLNIDECSAYRHDVAVSGLIDRRCQQTTRGRILDVLTPPSHHRTPAFDVVRSVVGTSDFVFVDMRQRDFDQLRIPPMLVQDGAGHGAHAVADQAVLETHALQRHVGGLAVGVGARISICREHVFPVAAVGLERLQ